MINVIKKGDLEKLQQIYKNGGNLYFTDRDRQTPLHHAGKNGSDKIVKYIYGEIQNMNNSEEEIKKLLSPVDWYGKTPLDYAIENNYGRITTFLLERGTVFFCLHSIVTFVKYISSQTNRNYNYFILRCMVTS